jgi:hypothetical protein
LLTDPAERHGVTTSTNLGAVTQRPKLEKGPALMEADPSPTTRSRGQT